MEAINSMNKGKSMILVAGSANLDFVVRADHIPQPGETVLGRDFQTFPGGKGANQAIASSRAGGVPTQMLVALGSDSFATPIEESLRGSKVALELVRSESEPTGTAFMCVSADGENAITVAPGANFELRPEHLPALSNVSHLLLQLEIPLPTVVAYANTARSSGVCVVLNAAPAQALPAELLSNIDVLVVNQGELAALTQHAGSIAQCLDSLNISTVVVTLGSRGCCVRHLGEHFFQPAFQVTPVDTTAAGDTFCGSMTAALSLGSSMPEALRIASAAGALACTRLGAQSSIPTKAEIEVFLAAQAEFSTESIQALRSFCGMN